jgi:hypothetical protein
MDGIGSYILDGKKPVKEPDILKWALSFEIGSRRVALTEGYKKRVSTVFLGLDHSFGFGPPLLFETMLFGKGQWVDEYCERYSTWQEAEDGHRRACISVNLHPIQRVAKVLLWLPSIYIICRLVLDY